MLHNKHSANESPEIPPSPNRLSLPASAFQTPSTVYLVQTLSCYRSSTINTAKDDLFEEATNDDPTDPDCEKRVLGAYSVPYLANKLAGDHYVTLVTQGLKNKGDEGLRKIEIKNEIRREVQEMEEEGVGELFKRYVDIEEITDEAGEEGRVGSCVVWVEEVDVGGPRN